MLDVVDKGVKMFEESQDYAVQNSAESFNSAMISKALVGFSLNKSKITKKV